MVEIRVLRSFWFYNGVKHKLVRRLCATLFFSNTAEADSFMIVFKDIMEDYESFGDVYLYRRRLLE